MWQMFEESGSLSVAVASDIYHTNPSHGNVIKLEITTLTERTFHCDRDEAACDIYPATASSASELSSQQL